MLVAAYFLGRAEVAANLALVAASCGTALVLWTEPVLRIGIFIAVLAIVGVVTAVVVVLREQVLALVLRLRTLASHDSLTGALNRGAFEQRMDAELARASRSSTALSLVVFDVDHFKNLNDSYGHAAGDAALRGIGDVVASGMRRSDVFGRLGGEEFGCCSRHRIAGAAPSPTSCAAARRLAAAQPLTVSFGVAEVHASARRARHVRRRRSRLYAAKRSGRDARHDDCVRLAERSLLVGPVPVL